MQTVCNPNQNQSYNLRGKYVVVGPCGIESTSSKSGIRTRTRVDVLHSAS